MKTLFNELLAGETLSSEETQAVLDSMMGDGDITDSQIGAFLYATSVRLPSVDELVGAVTSLRNHVKRVKPSGLSDEYPMVDTCGTGGSGKNTFNTSTVSSFVVAAAGIPVAKHGNRAQTSKTGSADILEALGVNVSLQPTAAEELLSKTGFTFLFAPHYHPATKRVVGIRKELGFRTLFNFLGPLTNPAGVRHQVIGVSKREMIPIIAEALLRLGTERALVVHGSDGLDELTLTGETYYSEIKNGKLDSGVVDPKELGFELVPFEKIEGMEKVDSLRVISEILSGKDSSYASLVALNAAAAMYVADVVPDIAEGIRKVRDILASGSASRKLEEVARVSQKLACDE